MKRTKNVKTIRKYGKAIFKGLHDTLGYDFEKPHEIIRIAGNYTVNSVRKTVAQKGYTADAVVVILTTDKDAYWRSDKLKAVQVFPDKINIDFPTRWYKCGYSFDHFYSKGEFESSRKSSSALSFILVQEPEYIHVPTEPAIDYSERYRYKNECGYTCKLTACADGRQFSYNLDSWQRSNFSEVIDKSGYFVYHRRKDLQRQAAALRAKREKDAYLRTENTDKVETLRSMIQARKSALADKLLAAETADDVHEIGDALSWYNGFAGTMLEFERFCKKTAEKSFCSIAESEKAYSNLVDALAV